MGTGGSKGDIDIDDIIVSDPVARRGDRQTSAGAPLETSGNGGGGFGYASSEDGSTRSLPTTSAGTAGRGAVPTDDGPGMDSMEPEEKSVLKRSTPRPMWYTLVPLLVICACLVLTAGIRCRIDSDCSLLSAPSLGHFLNNTDTSALAVSSLNALIGVHYMLNVATVHMLKQTSACSVIFTIISSIILYVAVYACLLFPYWYIAIAALVAGGLWSGAICHGLRRYYAYRPLKRRLTFVASVFVLAVYAAGMVVYIVLSAAFPVIPAVDDFSGKQMGIFVSEIVLLVSGVLFCALLVFHTRGVTYMFQVRKSYVAGFEHF